MFSMQKRKINCVVQIFKMTVGNRRLRQSITKQFKLSEPLCGIVRGNSEQRLLSNGAGSGTRKRVCFLVLLALHKSLQQSKREM